MASKIISEFKGNKDNAVDMINFLIEKLCENDQTPIEQLVIVTAIRKELANQEGTHTNYK